MLKVVQSGFVAHRAFKRLSLRYLLLGIVAGLLAPTGLLFFGVIGNRLLDPGQLFLVLSVGGTTTFACLGWMIGRRDEVLLARNRELDLLSAALRELSNVDGLTGISNRRSFDDVLQVEVERSARYRQSCALVMIDLDGFKALNDEHGHQAGDQVLRHVGHLLASEKRAGDLVARYGGEEFAAILPHVDAAAALAWSERVRTHLAASRVEWQGKDLAVTASFGISAAPAYACTAAELISSADRALYHAKQLGRNHAVVDARPTLLSETPAVVTVR